MQETLVGFLSWEDQLENRLPTPVLLGFVGGSAAKESACNVGDLGSIPGIKPVNCIGDQPWIFIGRTEAEAEAPILWPPDAKSWLNGKDPDAGKDWRQEEKGTTEDEVVGWHHWLDGHEFEQALGVDDGQGGLTCCSSWDHRVRHGWVPELNWNEPAPD